MDRQGAAVILLGHGSRDLLWRRPIEAVGERLKQRHPDLAVRCAYMELEPPGLAAAAAELVASGVRRVTIVPMFLGTGKHARDDLPRALEGLRKAHTGVVFTMHSIDRLRHNKFLS
jgi:sirohydrochlorin cobaltochelatase